MKGICHIWECLTKRENTVSSRIVRLAVPSIFANITVPLVGMVDIFVAGHLGNAGAATAIGAIAIGTMLFDLLYWNFGSPAKFRV